MGRRNLCASDPSCELVIHCIYPSHCMGSGCFRFIIAEVPRSIGHFVTLPAADIGRPGCIFVITSGVACSPIHIICGKGPLGVIVVSPPKDVTSHSVQSSSASFNVWALQNHFMKQYLPLVLYFCQFVSVYCQKGPNFHYRWSCCHHYW